MISTYVMPLDEIDQMRPDHVAFLDEQEAKGVVVSAGRQNPPKGGVVILNVPTEEEAYAVMAQDPYVKGGACQYVATGYTPTRGPLKDSV